MILEVNPTHPEPRKIKKIVEVLANGGIIAYPTDTYYGIGCDLFNKEAIEKVYALKGRAHDQPLSIICCDLKNISEYAQVTNFAYKTMKRCLPGPYTFVLEASRLVPRIMLTKRKTIGIRVPDNEVAVAIVRELGHPIINTTAANPETDEPLVSPKEIKEFLGHAVDLIVDGGIVPAKPSSVVSLINDEPEVIREGSGDVSFFVA